ncbi:retrotransposon gag protein, partial [Trifolium medium]|nr:retrotransposon gag protein [Trifolium medium]
MEENNPPPPPPPRRTMGDYCKRTDTEHVSLGFRHANPVPDHITEDQKRLRLFAFSLNGHAKEWLQCLPSGTIGTWKELEDKFLELFLTHNQFQKRKVELTNFQQHDHESLYEAYERFKLLKRKCPNHNIDAMDQMQIFTGGMKIQHRMLLDVSAGRSIKNKTGEEVKELIEKICQNEYNNNNNNNTNNNTTSNSNNNSNSNSNSNCNSNNNNNNNNKR